MEPTPTPYGKPVSPSDLRRICDDPNDGRRNWYVTLAYRDLSRILAAYTHGHDCGLDGVYSNEATKAMEMFSAAHAEGDDSARRRVAALSPLAPIETSGRAISPKARRIVAGLARDPSDRPPPPGSTVLADRPLNANFCTFAMWSSFTLGREIRNSQLPIRLDGISGRQLRHEASRLVVGARRTHANELARRLGLGQRAILWDVANGIYTLLVASPTLDALPAVRNLRFTTVEGSSVSTDLATQAIADLAVKWLTVSIDRRGVRGLAQLRPQDLALGLASYHLARRAARQEEWGWVAELVLRGNLFIAAYEQHRVDQILDFPVEDFAADFVLERTGLAAMARSGVGRWRGRADRHVRRRLSQTRCVWSRFFTDQLLVVQAGDELLRVGRDLPVPPGQPSFLPDELQQLRDRWLQMLLYRYDHSYGDGHGTQSRVWSVFDDRMNFIVNFMRSRAQAPGLWREPFRDDALTALRNDELPRYDR